MEAHAGLGVPAISRATAKAASAAFDTYAKQLREATAWFDGQVLSASSIEAFQRRVEAVADALDAEAAFLEQRAGLHDATRPEPVPLLGVAVESDERGLELKPFSLNAVIDEVKPS